MLTITSGMIIKHWAQSSISFQHMSFWCPLFKSHPTKHHPNLGLSLQWATELTHYLNSSTFKRPSSRTKMCVRTMSWLTHLNIYKSEFQMIDSYFKLKFSSLVFSHAQLVKSSIISKSLTITLHLHLMKCSHEVRHFESSMADKSFRKILKIAIT